MEKEAALLESGKENKDLCSFYEDELTELYSSCGSDTCGECGLIVQTGSGIFKLKVMIN